jgi:DNA-binding LacI/PurR family transcriptional regulator
MKTFSGFGHPTAGSGGGAVAVTIHDVARDAQLSVSTVSRAFTTPELLRPETRERVLRVADQLGYRPNRAARGLITGRTGNIGVIVPDLANPFFPNVLKGAQARARDAGYAVFLSDTDEDPRAEADLIHAMAKQVDGVVLCSSRMSAAQLEQSLGLTTLVLLNRRVPDVPAVLMDSAGGMRQAVDHLVALGHRRCAYLAGPRNSWSNRERRRGLRAAARRGLEVIELGPFAPRYEAGLHAADLALAEGVTAILAYNDLIAFGVLTRLNDRQVAVPGEVSVLGFDDIPMAAMCTPSLTTVAMPAEQAGRAAVDLLTAMLGSQSGERHEDRRELPTQLIVRGSTSTAPAPGPARRARSGRSSKGE